LKNLQAHNDHLIRRVEELEEELLRKSASTAKRTPTVSDSREEHTLEQTPLRKRTNNGINSAFTAMTRIDEARRKARLSIAFTAYCPMTGTKTTVKEQSKIPDSSAQDTHFCDTSAQPSRWGSVNRTGGRRKK
jgi:hypothetical protein